MSARRRSTRQSPTDELSTSGTPGRATPRRSSGADTPYARLRQLAGAIHKPSTPLRRTPQRATPGSGTTRTAGAASAGGVSAGAGRPARPVAARQPAPSTPHALRALQQRRAAAAAASTPGRERRRSGRQQRETPRDVLRALSRLEATRAPLRRESGVAAAKAPARTSAGRAERLSRVESDETDEDEPRPDFTLPLDEDDSFQEPPRLSQGLDDDLTQVSIEAPKRDLAELGRYGRESLRLSDRFGMGDLEEGGGMDEDEDDGGGSEADDGDLADLDADMLRGGDTEDLRALLDRRQSLLDASLLPAGDAENSFALEIPADLDFDEEEDPEDGVEAESEVDGRLDAPLYFDEQTDMLLSERSSVAATPLVKTLRSTGRAKKTSRYGIEYPSLPAAMVKKMTAAALRASGNSKTKVNRDILAAVTQASDWFFEQMSDDVAAYADHARRKTIDESDVLTLMRRQRVLNSSTTPFSLAQKHLPKEQLQHIRMAQPAKKTTDGRRKRALETVAEESEDSP